MRYLTRELYEGIQTDEPDMFSRWEAACEAWHAALVANRNLLPPTMQLFAQMTFHDSVVNGVRRHDLGNLVIRIDTTHAPWSPKGLYDLRFDGVVEASGLTDIEGDDWLYAEAHPHPSGFDYRVLLYRSELRVVAASVSLAPASTPLK